MVADSALSNTGNLHTLVETPSKGTGSMACDGPSNGAAEAETYEHMGMGWQPANWHRNCVRTRTTILVVYQSSS